jgi:hypothetical protein
LEVTKPPALYHPKGDNEMATTRKPKIPYLRDIRHVSILEYVFSRAARKWPNVKLGFVGEDQKTGDLYFQERGNSQPFIIEGDKP